MGLVRYDKRLKDIEFASDIADLPNVRVSPDQVQQVFLNLILNALDAMPKGGKLKVTMKAKGDYIEVRFEDSGPGIDTAVIDKVFDPFFTTKPLGKGTGLGLSICYGIIREHNGEISASSKPGGGAVFTILFPIDDTKEPRRGE